MSEQASLLAEKPPQQFTEFERRVSVRYQCGREASCSSLAPIERLSGRVRDISTQGVALLLGTSIREGTELIMDLKTRNPGICLTLRARVIHATLEAEGTWVIGGEFITVPSEEQLQALL
jgi:hypothetical protein